MLCPVWTSANQGRTWRKLNTNPLRTPPGRAVHGSVVGKYRDTTDAIYIMYGWLRGSSQQGIGNVYTNVRSHSQHSTLRSAPASTAC